MNVQYYISNLLKEMKISPKYLGYIYLEAIVIYTYENRIYLKSLSRFVYPEIASRFLTAPKSVEKAIDNAISKAYHNGGLVTISEDKCPSNKEVISYFVNTLYEQINKLNVRVMGFSTNISELNVN